MSLSELLRLSGASGDEEQVRAYICRQLQSLPVDVAVDSLGNVIAGTKAQPGAASRTPRVMLAAHMDEPGMIITSIHSSGMLTFKPIGTLDAAALLGSRVLVGKKEVLGVIGGKPIHRLQGGERQAVPHIDDMMIDIGAADDKEAAGLVSIGDYAVFAPTTADFGNNRFVKGKALPSRTGCAVLLQLLAMNLPLPFTAVFTTQKEVGLRGAQIAAYRINPDAACVIDAYPAQDFPGMEPPEQEARLGDGPVLIADDGLGGDVPLTRWLAQCADAANVPVQWRAKPQQRRETRVIQAAREGIRAVTLALPCRYIGAPYQVMAHSDIEYARQLITEALMRLAKGETLPC